MRIILEVDFTLVESPSKLIKVLIKGNDNVR